MRRGCAGGGLDALRLRGGQLVFVHRKAFQMVQLRDASDAFGRNRCRRKTSLERRLASGRSALLAPHLVSGVKDKLLLTTIDRAWQQDRLCIAILMPGQFTAKCQHTGREAKHMSDKGILSALYIHT